MEDWVLCEWESGTVVCLPLKKGMNKIQNKLHGFEKGSDQWADEMMWFWRQDPPHSLVKGRLQSSGRWFQSHWPISIFWDPRVGGALHWALWEMPRRRKRAWEGTLSTWEAPGLALGMVTYLTFTTSLMKLLWHPFYRWESWYTGLDGTRPESRSKLWSWDLNLDWMETLLSLEQHPFTKTNSAEFQDVAWRRQGVLVEWYLPYLCH